MLVFFGNRKLSQATPQNGEDPLSGNMSVPFFGDKVSFSVSGFLPLFPFSVPFLPWTSVQAHSPKYWRHIQAQNDPLLIKVWGPLVFFGVNT